MACLCEFLLYTGHSLRIIISVIYNFVELYKYTLYTRNIIFYIEYYRVGAGPETTQRSYFASCMRNSITSPDRRDDRQVLVSGQNGLSPKKIYLNPIKSINIFLSLIHEYNYFQTALWPVRRWQFKYILIYSHTRYNNFNNVTVDLDKEENYLEIWKVNVENFKNVLSIFSWMFGIFGFFFLDFTLRRFTLNLKPTI